jgi:prepilin-type N-terminal cleavage/methylation domain-containing protein
MHSDFRPFSQAPACLPSRFQRGFTLVEVLAVLIIVAILAGVGTPIYLNYIKSARSADAQTTISAIVTAEKINYQKTGSYVNDLEALRKGGVQIDEATEVNWKFEIGASQQQFTDVKATSTEEMPGGAGHTVEYKVQTGKFTGYGIDD